MGEAYREIGRAPNEITYSTPSEGYEKIDWEQASVATPSRVVGRERCDRLHRGYLRPARDRSRTPRGPV